MIRTITYAFVRALVIALWWAWEAYAGAYHLLARLDRSKPRTGASGAKQGEARQLTLDLPCRDPSMAMASIPLARSRAIGRLYTAVVMKAASLQSKDIDKKSADNEIFNACQNCYENGVTRTEVHRTIRAVASEHQHHNHA